MQLRDQAEPISRERALREFWSMQHTATRDLEVAKLIAKHSKVLIELEKSLTPAKYEVLMRGVTDEGKYQIPEVIKTDEYFVIKQENNFFQNTFGYLKKAASQVLNAIRNEGNIYEEEFRPVKNKIDEMASQYKEKTYSQVGINSPTHTRMSPILLAAALQDKIDRDKKRPLEEQKYKDYNPLVIDAFGEILKKAIYEQLVAQSDSKQLDLIVVYAGEGHVVPVTLRKDDSGVINAYYFEAAGDEFNITALKRTLEEIAKENGVTVNLRGYCPEPGKNETLQKNGFNCYEYAAIFSPKLSKMSLDKLKAIFEISDNEKIQTPDLPVSFLKYSQSRTILSAYQSHHADSLAEEDSKLLESTIQAHNLIQLDPKIYNGRCIAEKRHNPIVAKTQKFYEAISRQLEQMDTDDKRVGQVQKLQKRLDYKNWSTAADPKMR